MKVPYCRSISKLPVSVIIPCYRCVDTVWRAVISVLAQTSYPAELILVEDCSDDQGATLGVLNAIKLQIQARLPVIVLEMLHNGGAGEARNLGWQHASQQYIAFLDADDAWHPRKLAIQYQWMQLHPAVDISFHPTIISDNASEERELADVYSARPTSLTRLLFANCIPTRSVMLKRVVDLRFAPGMRYSEDYYLWLSLICSGSCPWRINLPLAFSFKHDVGHGGLSGNMRYMHQGELSVYSKLLFKGHIGYFLYFVLICFSRLKYLRRKLAVAFRSFV